MPAVGLPFLTLSDPKVSGEGQLDPLGLSTFADHLADWILPGFTARMHRPRFLTAIAVAAAVCDGLEDEVAADDVSSAALVFEWLLVEGFVRAASREDVRTTPGIEKAATARDAGLRMSASAYLKTPTVFGFHGVYRRLATHLRIINSDVCLGDNGYALVRVWEREQGLTGFLDSASNGPNGMRQILRGAVQEGLRLGYSSRVGNWQGWQIFARHLAPAKIGPHESDCLRRLNVENPEAGCTNEIFHLLSAPSNLTFAKENVEAMVLRNLLPQASHDLAARLRAIAAYEELCTRIEDSFDWLRYLSSHTGARALTAAEFASVGDAQRIAAELRPRIGQAEAALAPASPRLQSEFGQIVRYFDAVAAPADLYDAVLQRHGEVQRAKPPEGKREWFERGAGGSVFVRVPYRLADPPSPRERGGRPYRLDSVASFCADLSKAYDNG